MQFFDCDVVDNETSRKKLVKNIHQKKVEEKLAADEEEKRKVEEQKVFLSEFLWALLFEVFRVVFTVWFYFFPNRTPILILNERILLLISIR